MADDDEEEEEEIEERDADADALIEKLVTVNEFFEQKNDEYLSMEEQYEQTRRVSPLWMS